MFREENYPFSIPTWENDEWIEDTVFDTKTDFVNFLLSIFKEPGDYEFDESVDKWKVEAYAFNEKGYFCKAPRNSRDFLAYWEDQKNKCRKGAIYKNGDKKWYISRDYYMWLNFLPLFDKEKSIYSFPNIWDAQYHMALYEILAELHHKHSAILKKRQIASSYFHCGKLINFYWFEEGAKLKIGASLKDYINIKGSWKMIQEYSDFLNEHTAWYRPHNPGKVMDWTQQIEMTINGRDIKKGLKSTLTGHTFEKDPTAGVGGPCRYFFHEEGGIAPKANKTYEFMRPALHSGMVSTGMFIIAGSVGDLSQCEPLREYVLHPVENDFYPVESNLIDKDGTIGIHALFIPEQWSMPPHIDEFGNSLVEAALEAIMTQREQWKKDLDPATYQLRISQKPINIDEAFAFREASVFPPHLLTNQMRRIEDNQYGRELIDIQRSKKGNIILKESKKSPITEFPVRKAEVDKEGCVVVWERPPKEKPEHGVYYASIDPVAEGKTTTSDSLCSIYVYKNTLEVKRPGPNGDLETFIEPGKIVAAWCGRYDDINKTHERLELIIEWYNAWALVENNISLFILHMIAVRKQKYLVPKDQILFLKNIGSNANVFQEYGWKNTGTLFSSHMISYAVEYISETIDEEIDEKTGEILSVTHGIERIPDPMMMKEMAAYQKGVNVDRLVSLAALIAFVRIQESNKGYKRIVEKAETIYLEKSPELFKLNKSAFSNIGRGKRTSGQRKPRNPFRNVH